MKISKKTSIFMIILVLGVLILSILTYSQVYNLINPGSSNHSSVSKLVNNANTKSYSSNNISFNYPADWTLMTTNAGGSDIITVSKNDFSNNNQDDITMFELTTLAKPFSLSDQQAIKMIQNSRSTGWKHISNSTLTIDNNKANEDLFIVNDSSNFTKIMKVQQISFVKNEKIYTLIFQAPENSFDSVKSYFDTILNTIQIQ